MIGNDGRVVAVREEALADVSTAIFVDLPPGAYMRVLVLVCVCVCVHVCILLQSSQIGSLLYFV